jgi:hypothetical protein
LVEITPSFTRSYPYQAHEGGPDFIIGRSLPMDLSRPIPMTTGTPVLDHDLLIASVAVRQASTATAALAQRLCEPVGHGDACRALVALFGGEDGGGAMVLGGSFHPRVARAAAGKMRSTLMKAEFTLAF